MSQGKAFAIIRVGLLDHALAGKLSAFDLGVYLTIHLQADFATGKWRGSAKRLHATLPRGASLRDIQRALQNLTRIGFLRPFRRHGRRGNYVVLIDKYSVRIGALKGKKLNALASDSCETPVYESCAVTDTEADTGADTEAAPYQYSGIKNQENLARIGSGKKLEGEGSQESKKRANLFPIETSNKNTVRANVSLLAQSKSLPKLNPHRSPEIVHLEAGIYRHHVSAAYFDSVHHGLSHREGFRKALDQAILSLLGNRGAVDLRAVREESLRDAAWTRLAEFVEPLAQISDYSRRENQVVSTIARVVVEEALRITGSRSEAILSAASQVHAAPPMAAAVNV